MPQLITIKEFNKGRDPATRWPCSDPIKVGSVIKEQKKAVAPSTSSQGKTL